MESGQGGHNPRARPHTDATDEWQRAAAAAAAAARLPRQVVGRDAGPHRRSTSSGSLKAECLRAHSRHHRNEVAVGGAQRNSSSSSRRSKRRSRTIRSVCERAPHAADQR